NACLHNAAGDYLAFIDDDEVPAVDWLTSLVEVAERCRADAVQGSVVGQYPGNAPRWAARLRPFDKTCGATGARVEVGSTCNLLLRRSSLRAHQLQFDVDFGRSGGEDTDLCYRLTTRGGVIVCAPDAVVYENVPRERLRCRHLVRRYARGGHTYASVVLARQGLPRRALELLKAFALSAAFALLAIGAALFRPAAAMRYALRLAGNVGKLFFFLGLPPWNLY
ncbi:MAG: glycosyltransferase, partial [Propionivibrio sp.]